MRELRGYERLMPSPTRSIRKSIVAEFAPMSTPGVRMLPPPTDHWMAISEKHHLIERHEAAFARLQEENQAVSVALIERSKEVRSRDRKIRNLYLVIGALVMALFAAGASSVGACPASGTGREIVRPLDGRVASR